MTDLERLHKATKPFADLVNRSSGRLPVERLSLADWHALVKAYNDCNIPPELLCEDEGCDHHGIDHVCVNSSGTAAQLKQAKVEVLREAANQMGYGYGDRSVVNRMADEIERAGK